MTKYVFGLSIVFAIALLVVSCDNDDTNYAGPVHYYGEVTVDGRTRTFLVNVPAQPAADTKFPVVFMFHGTGGNANQAEKDYGWTEKSSSEKFIVVYPEGVQSDGQLRIRTWNAGKCCQYAEENNIDDVKFVNTLLDHLIATYPVDESKVYATGMSNGAMLVYRLACELPARFAALASVSGTMMVNKPCSPSASTPLLDIHSINDTKVPYAGGQGLAGYRFTPVDSAINVVKATNGCNDSAIVEEPGYTHRVINDCSTDASIETYLLKDGGHSWPGGQRASPRSDVPSTVISATDIIWEFFNKYER